MTFSQTHMKRAIARYDVRYAGSDRKTDLNGREAFRADGQLQQTQAFAEVHLTASKRTNHSMNAHKTPPPRPSTPPPPRTQPNEPPAPASPAFGLVVARPGRLANTSTETLCLPYVAYFAAWRWTTPSACPTTRSNEPRPSLSTVAAVVA